MTVEAAIGDSLLCEINDVRSSMNFLRAGAVLHPAMDEAAEMRFGRVVAAQLSALAIRGHLWFSYGGEYFGPKGMLATRHPDPSDVPDAEEQRLLDLLFAGEEVTRLARDRPGWQWDELAALIRQGLKAGGLGWVRRARYRLLRRLVGLRAAMRDHAHVHRVDGGAMPPTYTAPVTPSRSSSTSKPVHPIGPRCPNGNCSARVVSCGVPPGDHQHDLSRDGRHVEA